MPDVDDEAQQVVAVVAAEWKADAVAAFYRRLRSHKVPAPAAYDFTMCEYYPDVTWAEDLDD